MRNRKEDEAMSELYRSLAHSKWDRAVNEARKFMKASGAR